MSLFEHSSTCLYALLIHDVKGKEMVSEFHISPPSMLLDTKTLLLCFFIKPRLQDVVLKHQFFFQVKYEMEFPKACYCHPTDG